jgi:hypothetical protein
MAELKAMLKETTVTKAPKKVTSLRQTIDEDEEFTIDQVWNLSGFKQVGEQLVGPNPVHGSKTGHNLIVKDDVWWCGRHRTGGGAKEALAVDCGLIDCSQSKRGCLKGLIWNNLAREAKKRGLI